MVAWEGYFSLHKFAGFSAFHLNHSKPFACPILLRSGNESLSDTNLVVSYKLGQVNTVNYLKIPKKFCFGVLTLLSGWVFIIRILMSLNKD